MSRSKGSVPTKRSYHQEYIFTRNIKALAITVQKLLERLKKKFKWVKLQGQGHRVKNNGTHGKVLSQGIFM